MDLAAVADAEIKRKLVQGAVFVKYPRGAKPTKQTGHKRFVWCTPDLAFLQYGNFEVCCSLFRCLCCCLIVLIVV